MAWYRRWWNVLRPERLQSDLERELAFHVRERAEDLRADASDQEAAARAARMAFGNFTAQIERTRDMDISRRLESFVRNLRYALRALRKSPGFTATVLATLALGIGANSAVFSAIDAVLLHPLPFPAANELALLSQTGPHIDQPFVAPVRLEDWNRLNRTFAGISGYYEEDASEISGPLPERLKWAMVAPRFLAVLGVAPVLGRDFSPREEHFGGPPAILISYRLWQRRFGGNPDVLGKMLRIGRSSIPIIGVMPASFRFPDRDVDLWSVSAPDAPFAQSRDATWFTVIGRMKPGVGIARAQADMASVQSNLGRQFPKTDARMTVALQSLKDATVGGVRRSLWLLFGSVSLLLLIACTNIAALLISRGAARQQEISVRFSLGASRASVAAQLLTEVLVLAVAGALAGLVVAAGALAAFRASESGLPRAEEIALNWWVLGYSLGCAVAATLLCGVLPAVRATSIRLTGDLAHGGRSQVSRHRPLHFVLVGAQVALAVPLLAGAGLLLRSFQELGRVSPGFDTHNVLAFHITTSWGETADPKTGRRVERILDGLRSIPGVESAATTYWLPGVPAEYQVELKLAEGRPESEPKLLAQARAVSPEYFRVMRIPLLAGQLCRTDSQASGMMVNRSFADTYLGGTQALGHHLTPLDNPYVHASEIRGIVGDARDMGLDRAPVPTIYWCTASIQPGTYFVVRSRGREQAIAGAVRSKLKELEPARSVYDLGPVADRVSNAYAENRMRTLLLTFFAVMAVALACVGLYGTLSYMVSLRRREMALRLALGAVRGQVVRQILGQGVRVALLGCGAGLLLAAVFTKALAGMLFGVKPTDALTLAGVIAIVLAVSVAASLLPAIRAARLEPMQSLREE
jgi:putative ABC transport system permease protein